jgi:hypothetical protein
MATKFSLTTITNMVSHTVGRKMRKRSENAATNDERMEAALEDLRKKVYRSVSEAAKAHGVAERTLRARKNGRNSRAQANEAKQLLSRAEEKALVEWIHEVSKGGYPPHNTSVRNGRRNSSATRFQNQ